MANDDGLEWLAGLQVVTNGRWWSSLNGTGIPEQKEEGTTRFARIQVDASKPIFPTPVRIGATINLGNYEFARVDVFVEPIGDILKAEESMDWAEKWAGEILNREVASAKGLERDPKPLPECPEHIDHMVIGLQYGLTLNVGNMNSRRIDYGYHIPTMPSIAEEAWGEMSAFIGGRIQKAASKFRSAAPAKTAKKKLPKGGVGI